MYTYSTSYGQSSVARLSKLNDRLSYVNVNRKINYSRKSKGRNNRKRTSFIKR